MSNVRSRKLVEQFPCTRGEVHSVSVREAKYRLCRRECLAVRASRMSASPVEQGGKLREVVSKLSEA